MTKPKIKPFKNTSNRNISGNFTNKEKLKSSFFVTTSSRQAQNISDDGSYWNNGRCEWGGSHSLDEDINVLADFFNSLAKVDDDINEIKLSANEGIFKQRKQSLVSKIQQLLNKCHITSSTSMGNVCCIWNDFFGNFLKKYLDNFSKQLTRQLEQIEKLEPEHQQQLLQLEDDLRNAEGKYNENLAKYNDPNTSPEEKTKLMILVNEALDDIKKVKSKLKYNPLANLQRYNYLDDLERLINGDAPEPSPNISGGNRGSGSGGGSGGSNQTPNPLENPKDFFEQNQMMIMVAVAILAFFYLNSQKDNDDYEKPRRREEYF